jgi:hypothetical protein
MSKKMISDPLIKKPNLNPIDKNEAKMDSYSGYSQSSFDFWQIYRGNLHKENV